jgi:2-methylcitrate dehydratase PrpD
LDIRIVKILRTLDIIPLFSWQMTKSPHSFRLRSEALVSCFSKEFKMEIERKLVDYIAHTKFEDLPADVVDLAKFFFLNILGTTVGGSTAEKCQELVTQFRDWGGKPESTILLYGGKVLSQNAAFVNSYMARALESDDGAPPGLHIGSAAVPAALAAMELVGGCSGKQLITALVLGGEIAGRVNSAAKYNDFCPTGSTGVFATATVAGKILNLTPDQIWNALGIVYIRSGGGSPQGNRDGALSIRLNQGFVAQEGLMAARLAQNGLTGPANFLQGGLGYFHLFSQDDYDPDQVAGDLGKRFDFKKTNFRRYPCCGSANPGIEATLNLLEEHPDITPENIRRVKVKMTPYSASIVDAPFVLGTNPRINAQYNERYTVANVLLRKACKIEHFEESFARDPRIMELCERIDIVGDPSMEKRHELSVDIEVITNEGKTYQKGLDGPPQPLTSDERMARFMSYISYGPKPLTIKNIEKIISLVKDLENLKDVRSLIPLLVWSK